MQFCDKISVMEKAGTVQKPCTWRVKMYKPRDRQINFDDFNQPLGLELDAENRWIIPASEKIYQNSSAYLEDCCISIRLLLPDWQKFSFASIKKRNSSHGMK
jgi:hypothetical protein